MKDEKFSSYYYHVIKLRFEKKEDFVAVTFKLGEQILGYLQDINNLDDLALNVKLQLNKLKRLYLSESEIMLSDNTVYLDIYQSVKDNINMFNFNSKNLAFDSVYVGAEFLNKGVY